MDLFHFSPAAFIKRWVADVEVLRVEVILRDAEGIGETVKVKCFSLRYNPNDSSLSPTVSRISSLVSVFFSFC